MTNATYIKQRDLLIPEGITLNNWLHSKPAVVFWADVTGYVIFETIEDFERCLKRKNWIGRK